MTNSTKYIIQFVGFKTTLNENDFIRRWTPFASNFKSQGILTIDLYNVANNNELTYISRNIWDEKTYFQNFPTGIAGSGSGGGISVTQLGGYSIQPDQLELQNEMQLLFLNDIIRHEEENIISCLSCTDKVPFKQVLIFNVASKPNFQFRELDIICKHIKRM